MNEAQAMKKAESIRKMAKQEHKLSDDPRESDAEIRLHKAIERLKVEGIGNGNQTK